MKISTDTRPHLNASLQEAHASIRKNRNPFRRADAMVERPDRVWRLLARPTEDYKLNMTRKSGMAAELDVGDWAQGSFAVLHITQTSL